MLFGRLSLGTDPGADRLFLIRPRLGGLGVLVIVTLLSGCWVDFPESRFSQDGPRIVARDSGQGKDLAIKFPDTFGGSADAARDFGGQPDWGGASDSVQPIDLGIPADGAVGDLALVGDLGPVDAAQVDGAGGCVPGTFVRCLDSTTLQWCDDAGQPVEIECVGGECRPALRRCNACLPSARPRCVGENAVSCAPFGVETIEGCPLGCEAGACCTDVDGDKVTTCGGDCNDGDPKVFPGQTAYFEEADSRGSFDFDCSTAPEAQYPTRLVCQTGSCQGEGWVDNIALCGAEGEYGVCRKSGGFCVYQSQTRLQACR